MVSRLGLCAATVLAGWFVYSSPALADERRHDERRTSLALALDFDYTSAVENDFIENGGGGALRIGSELDLLLVTLIPEVNLGYHTFGGNSNFDATALTGTVGGRIRFLKILEPGVFAHAGIGHVSGWQPHTGFAFDAGLTLDFTLLPLIDLGLHAAWNRVFGDTDREGLSYATAGFHVALVL